MKYQLFSVLLLCIAFGLPAAAQESVPDSVAIHPEVHHVLFDNEHVRVFRAMGSAGETSPMHSHPPFVLVSLGEARLQLTMPDGEKVIFDLLPGDVHWMGEGAQHSWELLSGHAHVVAVEVKSAVQ